MMNLRLLTRDVDEVSANRLMLAEWGVLFFDAIKNCYRQQIGNPLRPAGERAARSAKKSDFE
jgi:hypothetical protein